MLMRERKSYVAVKDNKSTQEKAETDNIHFLVTGSGYFAHWSIYTIHVAATSHN